MENTERAAYLLGWNAASLGVREEQDKELNQMLWSWPALHEEWDLHNNTLRRLWHEGYLDKSRTLGAEAYERARAEFEELFHVSVPPDSVTGKTYTLIFEQTNSYERRSHAHSSKKYPEPHKVAASLPQPVRILPVKAKSMAKALDKGWEIIAQGNKQYLSFVSLMGILLPHKEMNFYSECRNRYYNHCLLCDVSELKLQKKELSYSQFSRWERQLVMHNESAMAAAQNESAREIVRLLARYSTIAMPSLSEQFSLAYAEDTARSLTPEEKSAVTLMCNLARLKGSYGQLYTFLVDGILPDGSKKTEHIPTLSWNLDCEVLPAKKNSMRHPLGTTEHAARQKAVEDLEPGMNINTAHPMIGPTS